MFPIKENPQKYIFWEIDKKELNQSELIENSSFLSKSMSLLFIIIFSFMLFNIEIIVPDILKLNVPEFKVLFIEASSIFEVTLKLQYDLLSLLVL